MNSLVKDALKLVIITVVAGLVLGAVYGIAKKPIAYQEAKAQMEAYKAVFPKASDFKDVDGFSEEAASKVIASYKNTVDGHESDVISSAVEAVDASCIHYSSRNHRIFRACTYRHFYLAAF